MKHLWKKIMATCLVINLLLTGIPSMAAGVGDMDDDSPTQTSSVDWDTLFHTGQGGFALPEEGTYAPNRLLVTCVDSRTRGVQFSHSSIKGSSTLFSLPMPQEAQEAALMDANEETTITCTVVNLETGSDMLAVMEALSQEDGVLAVEFDRLHTVSSEPDAFSPAEDPLVEQQTWLNLMGATKAWDMLTADDKVPGDEVIVAVLDTGIDSFHPDLKDQIAPGGLRITSSPVFPEDEPIRYHEDYEDGQGHGTHVSGIIAGAKNGTGITGVAYGAKILPIKVLDDDGTGYNSGIVAGMLYAAGLIDEKGKDVADPEPRCQIANMSLGGNTGTASLAYESAAAALRDMGVFLVVAAGNEDTATSYVNPGNNYAPYTEPAYLPEAFAVMAMEGTPHENGDYLAPFSNWDSDPYAGAEYTLMAPGVDILSTIPDAYVRMSGTSMASPAVAGAAALVLSANPDYTVEDLWAVMATSGKKLQGKTDAGGKTYAYHTMDVVAALNTDPEKVKSVVKAQAKGYWREVPAMSASGDVLVLPTGAMPQVKLTLRGYDAMAYQITATSPDLTSRSRVDSLAPGETAEMIFTLKEIPEESIFETEISITWRNQDGSKGSDRLSLKLPVFAALPGEDLANTALIQSCVKQGITIIWVFEEETIVTLPNIHGETEYTPPRALYYFGENGSLEISEDSIPLFLLGGDQMIDPQILGKVKLSGATVSSKGVREDSYITIEGGMGGCTINDYAGLTLEVEGDITNSMIANCANTTVKASSILSSSLVNNLTFGEAGEPLEITVTENSTLGEGGEVDPSGFVGNAVVGPAKVLGTDGIALATALNCYYLPTAVKGDHQFDDLWVPDDINMLDCADGSTVYTEGTTEGDRPAMLEECPPFLISTQRAPDKEPAELNQRLAYELKSEFSRDPRPSHNPLPYYSSLLPPYGNLPVVNSEWATDGRSCTYTVYTSVHNSQRDDFYVLQGLDIPRQFDLLHPIHDRQEAPVLLTVKSEKIKGGFEVSWESADKSPLPAGTPGVLIWQKTGTEISKTMQLTPEALKAETTTVNVPDVREGDAYAFMIALTKKDKLIGLGSDTCYIPYAPPYDDISLLVNNDASATGINLSGTETVTLTLRANRTFNLKSGLKATVLLNGEALSLQSAVAPLGLFSGTAQQDDTAVAELAPSAEDAYIFEGQTIATLTLQGKNLTTDEPLLIALTDFFDEDLLDENDEGIAFNVPVKTNAVSSGGGNYTPPKQNTQTLPDGTLVTTTTNPDGSIQIVYKRPDGVRSTVKTPAKGEQSTASISLPNSLAGKSVNVTLPMEKGGITTVAFLVGADGKEQIIPGSFWKDGVLTVPLTDNANLILRDNAKTFSDLTAADWFADDVAFVTSHELFQGVGEGKFSPHLPTSRAMLFVVLQRLAGETAAPKDGATWYDDAMAWAKEAGISDGTLPMENITRQELAVMLYRYEGSPAATQLTATFPDSDQIAAWAQDAMAWAAETGILKGDANSKLNPTAQATRAEVATMLARFVSAV